MRVSEGAQRRMRRWRGRAQCTVHSVHRRMKRKRAEQGWAGGEGRAGLGEGWARAERGQRRGRGQGGGGGRGLVVASLTTPHLNGFAWLVSPGHSSPPRNPVLDINTGSVYGSDAMRKVIS